jgi:hypothetical protein
MSMSDAYIHNAEKICEAYLKTIPHGLPKLLCHLLCEHLRCTSVYNGVWYRFKSHKWHRTDDSYIENFIHGEFCHKLAYAVTHCSFEKMKSRDQTQKDKYKSIADGLTEIFHKITDDDDDSMKNLIKECRHAFYDADFHLLLDKNTLLVCHKNGVYDKSQNKLRDGQPDDYLSISTNSDYILPDAPSISQLSVQDNNQKT